MSKYFDAWAKVIAGADRSEQPVFYIDLMSGPGRYRDGAPSTPVMVLERAVANRSLHRKLAVVFNDADPVKCRHLERIVAAIPGADALVHRPEFKNASDFADLLSRIPLEKRPSLTFLDPFGYKEVSQALIRRLIAAWGSDCIFFFNYRRFNAAISNPRFLIHVVRALGSERATRLRDEIAALEPADREQRVLEELKAALFEMGGKYTTEFRFMDPKTERTSHYLIFVTKHKKGLRIMKDILAAESSSADEGVASFAYDREAERQLPLLSVVRPIDRLKERLIQDFRNQTISFGALFEAHHPGTRYVEANYRDALRQLEKEGRIHIDPPYEKRRTRRGIVTLPTRASIIFP